MTMEGNHTPKVAKCAGAPAPEHTGRDVNYYVVHIPQPKRQEPYTAECEDIIEALGMSFHEGNAFKAVWRTCAARTLGLAKKGNTALYNAEKVMHAGARMVAMETKLEKARGTIQD